MTQLLVSRLSRLRPLKLLAIGFLTFNIMFVITLG